MAWSGPTTASSEPTARASGPTRASSSPPIRSLASAGPPTSTSASLTPSLSSAALAVSTELSLSSSQKLEVTEFRFFGFCGVIAIERFETLLGLDVGVWFCAVYLFNARFFLWSSKHTVWKMAFIEVVLVIVVFICLRYVRHESFSFIAICSVLHMYEYWLIERGKVDNKFISGTSQKIDFSQLIKTIWVQFFGVILLIGLDSKVSWCLLFV